MGEQCTKRPKKGTANQVAAVGRGRPIRRRQQGLLAGCCCMVAYSRARQVSTWLPQTEEARSKRSRCCGGRRTRGGRPDVEAAPGRTKTPAGLPGKTLPGAAPAGAAGGGPGSRWKRTRCCGRPGGRLAGDRMELGPGGEEPSVEEPGVEEPSGEEPGVEEPSVEEPGVEEPGVEEPSGEEPGAGTGVGTLFDPLPSGS